MNFAKKELEKYGWKEGQGLGKKNDGISTALKPKLKFDNTGVGHNPGDEYSNRWWEDLYNLASSNLKVQKKDGEVKLGTKTGKSTDMDTNPYTSPLRRNNELEYGSFIKTAQLTESGVVNYQVEGSEKKTDTDRPRKVYNDEALYKACGAIHKGTRFGIYMSGKLNRLERQEKMLLKKLKHVSSTEAPILEKKVKKVKESKGVAEVDSPIKKQKKKKKNHRSVSFGEVVTEYDAPTEDANSESSRKDEGIEVDMNKTIVKFDNLSKAERKKLKKERQKRATARFLSNIDSTDMSSKSAQDVPEETHNIAGAARCSVRGARFGIYMSGKLNRLERQEKMLLKKMKNVSLTEAPILEKKVKKLKKSKGVAEVELALETIAVSPIKKQKKKKHRSVSFSEVITEYYAPTEDTNSESSRKDENNEPHSPESVSSTPDEGIEVDLNMNKTNKTVVKFDDLSKAERKKLKKKRENRATARFLSNIDSTDISSKSAQNVPEETHNIAETATCSVRYTSSDELSEHLRKMTELCDHKLEASLRVFKKRKVTLSQTGNFQDRLAEFMNLSSHDEEYNKMSEDQVNSKGQLKKSKNHTKNRDQMKHTDKIKNKDQHQEGASSSKTEGRKDKHDKSARKRKRKNEKQINEIVQCFSDCKISDDE